MEILKNYVDTMFRDFPDTDDSQQLKESILESMTEKYYDLIDEGKSDAEALGAVLAQFGDIEELKEAYEVKEDKSGFHLEIKASSKESILLSGSIIAFLIIGFGWGIWHPTWSLIPIAALASVKGSLMSYATILYIILGAWFTLWHPSWLIFPIAALLTSVFKNLRGRT